MFAGLPKLFDKNFVVGFLLPVVLGLIVFAWLSPALTILEPLRSIAASEETLGKLTYLVLLSYGLAIILVMTNTLQYRVLEGYLPPVSWLDTRRQRGRRQALADEYDVLMQGADEADWPRADALKRQLVADYPPLRLPVMPTRFGNAIRAFEAYPFDAYGADATPIWLRLASVIPKEFADGLEDARAQVNFLLNLLYLLPIVGAAALWRGALEIPWDRFWQALATGEIIGWDLNLPALTGVIAFAIMWPIYTFAVARAKAWGDVVKAAFDCYLPALIKQMGYAPPATDVERKALWREINALVVYWQPMDPEHYKLADAPTPAAQESPGALLRRLFG